MSTRSMIAIKETPKRKGSAPKLTAIYCHWDGYPSNNGKLLLENYTTPEKVKALMSLGDISSLGPELGDKHDFDGPIELREGVCTAYGRDRGEKGTESHSWRFNKNETVNLVPKKFEKDMEDSWCEWLYVFDESTGKWSFSRVDKTFTFKDLTPRACKID